MGSQLVYNKPAILEMDKNPAYKDPGETWGKNQISMVMWDYLEEGSAILDDAAWASQVLEGDKYVTASLVVPMAYRLMATSSSQHPVKFANRVEDEFNDDDVNPPKVPHDQLTDKIQTAREGLHEQLVDRFDTNVARDIKKFWFIAAMCDPRFKKLQFKHDRMLSDMMRTRAVTWFTHEFNTKYKGKVAAPTGAPDASPAVASGTAAPRHVKRRKTSAAGFFADSDEEESEGEETVAEKDELAEYLALPQIKYKTEEDAAVWWRENKSKFPNVEVMARQYLGCPASSASVERLFSQVGIAFTAKRKSADSSTIADLMFANVNLP